MHGRMRGRLRNRSRDACAAHPGNPEREPLTHAWGRTSHSDCEYFIGVLLSRLTGRDRPSPEMILGHKKLIQINKSRIALP